MGDALMQVLDIAEKIQKENAETPDASASPSPAATPGTSAAPDASAQPSTPTDEPSGQPLVAAILLSDGAQSVGKAQPLEAARRAKTLGVPIYTIALGTPDGEVEVQDDLGRMVTLEVPPDTETLAQIASITGGTNFTAPTAADLASVYANLESRIGHIEERQEVTFALVGAGLLLVVLGAGLSAVWFGRLPVERDRRASGAVAVTLAPCPPHSMSRRSAPSSRPSLGSTTAARSSSSTARAGPRSRSG